MTSSFFKSCLLLGLLVAVTYSSAQTSSQKAKDDNDSERGFTEVESVQSTLSSQDRMFKLDSNLGWAFNQHFGMFAGVPVYFVNVPSSTTTIGGTTTTTPATSNNGIGNAYLGFAFQAPGSALGYASTLTAAAPTGSTQKGLSSGRVNVDWDNRFEHTFQRFTPFFEGGLGNSVPDSRLFVRPFTSLGFITHLEEGAGFELAKHFSVNGSAYEIVPFGSQKIFSKLVAKGKTGKAGSKNVFQSSATASGNGLTRENGFNTWVEFEPTPAWDLSIGYTRSTTFALSGFAFNLRMNVGKLLHSRKVS